jgi:DNA-binding Xre family transcriptional regulator
MLAFCASTTSACPLTRFSESNGLTTNPVCFCVTLSLLKRILSLVLTLSIGNVAFVKFSNVRIHFVKVARSFFVWLEKELQERGWTEKQLCEKAGIQQSGLTVARSGTKGITTTITNAIAKALDVEAVEVAIRAGLVPAPQGKINYGKIVESMNALEQQLIEQDDTTLKAIEEFGIRARQIREGRERYNPKG